MPYPHRNGGSNVVTGAANNRISNNLLHYGVDTLWGNDTELGEQVAFLVGLRSSGFDKVLLRPVYREGGLLPNVLYSILGLATASALSFLLVLT